MDWTPAALPDLKGRTYFITGGNSGTGLEATRILCRAGARVVIGSRSVDKGETALAGVRAEIEGASCEVVQLDLTKPQSIEAAVAAVIERAPTLNALVNNAGII